MNKFGLLDARPNEKKDFYDKFKSVVSGGGQEKTTAKGMMENGMVTNPDSMKQMLENGKLKKGAYSQEAFLKDVNLMEFDQ